MLRFSVTHWPAIWKRGSNNDQSKTYERHAMKTVFSTASVLLVFLAVAAQAQVVDDFSEGDWTRFTSTPGKVSMDRGKLHLKDGREAPGLDHRQQNVLGRCRRDASFRRPGFIRIGSWDSQTYSQGILRQTRGA